MIRYLLIVITFGVFLSNPVYSKSIQPIVQSSTLPNLIWTPVPGASSYRVKLKEIGSDGKVIESFDAVSVTNNEYKITNALNHNSYYKVVIKAKGTKAKKLVFYIYTQNQFVTIQAQHYLPSNSSYDDKFFDINNGYLIAYPSRDGGNSVDVNAHFKLPNASIIVGLEILYNKASGLSTLKMERRGNGEEFADRIDSFGVQLSGTGDQVSSTNSFRSSDSENVINNNSYVYYCEITGLDENDVVKRVNVYYIDDDNVWFN